MAIIYSYPQINLSSISADDLMIISDMNADGRPTKSLTLKNLADFVTSTGTGTGTTNKIIKWSDGPAGLLGDSIMTENATQIDLAGTFLSTSSPTGTSGPIHGIRANQTSTATGAFNIALYGDSKHTGANKGSYNYGLYTKAEFEGTNGYDGVLYGAYTEARYDGSGTNATWSSLYGAQAKARVTAAATGDLGYMIGNNVSSVMDAGTAVDVEFLQGQHTNVTFNSGNVSGSIAVNLLDFDYPGGGTLQGDFAYLQIQNDPVPTPVAGTARAINSDSTLPSHFSGDVEIPLIPTANAHATSKQYVDQQIASIPAGLVFQGNWNASTNTPTLASGTGTVGNYYVVSVAGNTNLDGITDWEVGDWAVFVEVGGVDKWDKIDQTFVQGAGATGQVSFWNGVNSVTGDNDLYWDNANKRLGIGTTSPGTDKLRVSSTGRVARILSTNDSVPLVVQNSGTQNARIGFKGTTSISDYHVSTGVSGQDYSIHTNDTERLRITSGGNVGIGTTSPAVKLEVNGGIGVGTTGGTFLVRQKGDTSSDGIAITSSNGTSHRIFKDAAGTFFIGPSTDPTAFTQSLSGNVGIGTNSPDKKLDVTVSTSDDGVILQTSSGRKSLEMLVDNGTNGQGKINFYTGANLLYGRVMADSEGLNLDTIANRHMRFMQNTTEVMRIDTNQNVGIGTNSPAEKLSLPDNAKIGLGTSADLQIYHDGTNSVINNTNGHLQIYNNANDGDISFISDNGSGGTTEYFRVDGGDTITRVARNFRANDNVALQVGVDGDAGMYHDGTNTYIQNDTGDLYIRNNSNDKDIVFQSDNGSGGTTEYFRVDGSDERMVVSKNMDFLDNVRLRLGTGSGPGLQDLQIYHSGTHSFIDGSSGAGSLYLRPGAGGTIQLETISGADMISANATDVRMYSNGNERVRVKNIGINIQNVPTYADNAAAIAGGLTTGDVYRTGDLLKIVH